MTEPPSFQGLDADGFALVAAIWNEPAQGLRAYIKTALLDPGSDFVGGDFRGWPLAGQDVRGIDFSRADLRGSGIEHAIRDETTILTDALLDDGQQVILNRPLRRRQSQADEKVGWVDHWHSGVHRAFGKTLYLVLLSFVTDSIVVKPSIVNNLRESGITDYMIFNLYSQWDVAIRAWADDESIEQLKRKLRDNGEINHTKGRLPVFQIDEIAHFPENGAKYLTVEAVKKVLENVPTDWLRDIQDKGDQSPHFQSLQKLALILDDATRFAAQRIQFYIFVTIQQAPEDARVQLLKIVENSKEIKNKSVMFTPTGSSIFAIVKGQVAPSRFYDIHGFLRRITKDLREILRTLVETETMLVANQHQPSSARIDFDRSNRTGSQPLQVNVEALVAAGESDHVEFKSTLRTNLATNKEDDKIIVATLKTIAAFLNTNGGHLIIGLTDDRRPVGIQADNFASEDKMLLYLSKLIRDRIGLQHVRSIRMRFENYRNGRLLVVDCTPGSAAAYLKDNNRQPFYVRSGPETNELHGEELQTYLRRRYL
jgi:hypothetical protein